MDHHFAEMSKEELVKRVEELEFKLRKFESEQESFLEDRLRLELAIDTVDMAWWSMDVVTGAVEFHKRKAEMLGYPPEKFKHYQDFTDMVHPDDIENAMESMRNHFKGIARTYETGYRIKTAQGAWKWFYDIGAIVKRDENGAPLRIVGFVIDMTKQKAAEEELQKANRDLQRTNAEKDRFFSIIAHDLRSPIATLIQTTEILNDEDEELTEEETGKLLNNLGHSAKSAFKLLENLLEWASMKSGRISFEPVPLPLINVVNDAVRLLHHQADLKRITLKNGVDANLRVTADKNMTSLVIRNLIANSIKFTPEGGNVEIFAVSLEDGFVRVSVKDTGIGMPGDIIENMFKIDTKVSRPGTNGEPSTGLGLLLCHEFVEKHNGEIWAESEENVGTVFHFTLPAAK
ncbi:MAG: PAS domain-containing sensor histidine kinase [Bacteroidetes bacterium]|nr:PAS domain-containing sensor histidine kinase [Bacteroidota bacterium]